MSGTKSDAGTDPVERDLATLGLLPTAECPVQYRALGESGYGLFLHLDQGIRLSNASGTGRM